MRRRHLSLAWLVKLLRPLLLAAVVGMALAFYTVLPLPGRSSVPVAQACGLGATPTMLGNKTPALLYPVTKDTPANIPIGIFAQDYLVNQSITFDEDLSAMVNAPPKTSLQWQWDFGDHSGFVYQMNPKHTYKAPGTYNVRVHIRVSSTDSWGPEFDSAQIHVIQKALPNPPLAKITASTAITAIQENVILDASGSHSRDGSKLSYFWNFNDASTATGPYVTHQFPQGGKTFVALIVTDGRGAKSVATFNVNIQPYFGVKAKLSASADSVASGTTVSFDASQTPQPTNPPNNEITRFDWDFGDGSGTTSTQDPTTTHTFTKAGIYTVTVEAIDRQGAAAPAQVRLSVTGGGATNSSDNKWPFLLIGALVLLLAVAAGGFYLLQEQRKNEALARRHAQELARARRGHAPRSGGGRRSRPGDGTAPAHRPPASGTRRNGPPPERRW
jgi:PKD repeat protein